MKPTRVVMIDDAKKALIKLNEIVGIRMRIGKTNSAEIQMLNSIKNKIDLIKQNPFYGDNIRKDLIPKKYKVPNLWRVELTNYWRRLYTIRGDEVEVICFVLEIVSHKDYDKIMGYKK
ncbi:MAG: hypothetical protein KJ592_03270 [Nanoarchaeota archaeon]|nr:hypothetical protein [Nanoarchaeota archaeon]